MPYLQMDFKTELTNLNKHVFLIRKIKYKKAMNWQTLIRMQDTYHYKY